MNHLSDTNAKAKKKKHILPVVIISLAVLAAIAAVVFGKQYYDYMEKQKLMDSTINKDTFYDGISVEGIKLGGKTMEEAKTEVKAKEPSLREKYKIEISYKQKKWTITENDFAFQFNTDEVLKKAYEYARGGDKETRYKQVVELRTSPKNFTISQTMTYDNLKDKISAIAKEISYAPKETKIASFNTTNGAFTYKEGTNGLAVEENKLYTQVEKLINGEKVGKIEVPTQVVPYKITQEQMKSNIKKLGSFSTVSTNTANGNHNMRLALAKANGLAIEPGATFSFNGMTGNTTTGENGYLKAGAIVGGKSVQEYGGGICQVSTTIYGAALRSNMQIVTRYNHRWPSTYCPIGLDATVSYPTLDFKFKNTSAYPVYIVAGMSGTKLTVTFFGYQSPDYDRIEVVSNQTETIPMPGPVYKVDSTLKKGQKVLDIKGNVGRRATASRIYYKNGAVVKTEALHSSYYRPVAPVYLVGSDSDIPKTSSSSTSSSKPANSAPNSSSSANSSSKPS